MAGAGDIRDIMDLDSGPRPPAPKKKKKLVEPKPHLTGMSREVQALMGDSIPPIALVEAPKYKSKPSIANKLFKPRHWEERPFQHAARQDGLVMRHWKRAIPGTNTRAPAIAQGSTPTDVEMTDENRDNVTGTEVLFEDEFLQYGKWNVKVDIESYTDEQYEQLLKADDWTKQETDYLMQLCRDYDLRWILVADRYDPADIDPDQTGEVDPTLAPRSMEALKSRYYTIAAKMLELRTPPSSMTGAEYQLFERMKNFDAKTESNRKQIADKLFERTKEESEEERILLEELQRIDKNEEEFIKMRKDLYARLEGPPLLRRGQEDQSTAMYGTSSGLSMLLQNLLAREKRFKRPAVPEGPQGSTSATPVDRRQPGQHNRRDTMDTQATEEGGPHRKSTATAPVRTLTPTEEARFGVSHLQERVTSGVAFRHEKINRLTMAKSQVQTSKIQAALIELGIPPRLLMPTERVCREFERLIGQIQLLLDARKGHEKVSSEVKVLEEMRRIRLGLPREGEGEGSTAMEIDTSQVPTEPKSDLAAEQIAQEESSKLENDDDDAEGDDDDQKEDGVNESSMQVDEENDEQEEEQDEEEETGMTLGKDDDEEADEEEDEEDEDEGDTRFQAEEDDEDEEEDEDDEEEDGVAHRNRFDPGDEANIDEEEEEDEEEDDEESEPEPDDEPAEDPEENKGDDAQSGKEDEAEQDDDDEPDEDEGEDASQSQLQSRPASAHSAAARSHKRSASLISEASKAGSNRSAVGRKRRK